MVVKTIRMQLSTCVTTTDPITEVQYLGYSINRLLWITTASFHVTNIDKCVHDVAGYYTGAYYGYGSQRPTYSNNYYQQQQPSYNHNYHHQQQPAYNYNYAAPSSSSYHGSNSNNYQSYQSYTNYQSYTSSNQQQQQYNYQQHQPSFGGYYGGGMIEIYYYPLQIDDN